MKSFEKIVSHCVILGVGLFYLAFMFWFMNRTDLRQRWGTFDLDNYAALPVQDGGRFKPMDTVARISLMLISGKQTFLDEKGNRQPAIRWLLDVDVRAGIPGQARSGPELQGISHRQRPGSEPAGSRAARAAFSLCAIANSPRKSRIFDKQAADSARIKNAKNATYTTRKSPSWISHLGLFHALGRKPHASRGNARHRRQGGRGIDWPSSCRRRH